MTRASVLLRAARHLSDLARDVKGCNTVRGRWLPEDEPARREWAELRSLAFALRRMARGRA